MILDPCNTLSVSNLVDNITKNQMWYSVSVYKTEDNIWFFIQTKTATAVKQKIFIYIFFLNKDQESGFKIFYWPQISHYRHRPSPQFKNTFVQRCWSIKRYVHVLYKDIQRYDAAPCWRYCSLSVTSHPDGQVRPHMCRTTCCQVHLRKTRKKQKKKQQLYFRYARPFVSEE